MTNTSTPEPSPSNTLQNLDNSTSPLLDIIAANDLTSRANYVYLFLAALGLISACFLLYSFIQTYRAQRRLAWLDCLLWAFCGSQLLLVLLSLSSVAHRPGYLKTTLLACAALSFAVNVASLCGMLLLVLMAYVLTFDPPSHVLLRRPGVSVSLVMLASIVSSMLLAGIRGPSQGLETEDNCVVDPVQPGRSYAVAKLCLSFLIPYTVLLGLLIGGCFHQWKSSGRFLSGAEERPMFLTVAIVMFVCQLFHSIALVRGGGLLNEGGLSHHEQAFLNVAEFVLFSGSALSLLLVLLVHRSCRESLKGVLRQLRDCCQSLGGAQTNRHIVAPQIEITDTLQDFEH